MTVLDYISCSCKPGLERKRLDGDWNRSLENFDKIRFVCKYKDAFLFSELLRKSVHEIFKYILHHQC